jgi:hypothetical protein
MNVTIDDIKAIEQELDVELTNEQRDTILKQYQRVVMDNADNWNVILKDLINGMNVDNRKHR